jgi:hypothetical protein
MMDAMTRAVCSQAENNDLKNATHEYPNRQGVVNEAVLIVTKTLNRHLTDSVFAHRGQQILHGVCPASAFDGWDR